MCRAKFMSWRRLALLCHVGNYRHGGGVPPFAQFVHAMRDPEQVAPFCSRYERERGRRAI